MTGKLIFIIFMVILAISLVVLIWILTPEESVKEGCKKNLSEDDDYKEYEDK